MTKKGFFIIFHRYYFYTLAVIVAIVLMYNYADEKGLIKENSSLDNIEKMFELQPPDSSLIEQKIFSLVNQERANNGLKPLEWDSQLALIAREHSEDMVNHSFFDHINPDGEDPTDRAEKKGIPITSGLWIGIAENVGETPIGDVIGCGYVSNEDDIASCAVSGWMSSPGHRANILDSHYDVIGVGTYCTTSKCLNTQDFR